MLFLKKIKRERDPRINIKDASLRHYIIMFLVLGVLNGLHTWLYQAFYRGDFFGITPRYQSNILGLYIAVAAAFFVGLIAYYRHITWNIPMYKLGEAAKKVAKGDFSTRITPLRKDGKKDYTEVMFEDFNTMVHELQSIEILKNDFIANVSHEIKTPLAVIQSYAAALQDDNLEPEKRREYINTILGASQKLSTLISNILKLNKLENQEILPEAKPFDLGEQLRQCAVAFVDAWERKNIDFEAELDDVTVCYDESILEIVWNNLLSNAIKFTDPYGSITIKLEEKDGYARVSISNTGVGMDEETLKHVFDKFYQGDTSHNQEGNGLGLALVKRAVELLGGTVSAESRPDQGATFTVCLKVAGADKLND